MIKSQNKFILDIVVIRKECLITARRFANGFKNSGTEVDIEEIVKIASTPVWKAGQCKKLRPENAHKKSG